MANQFVPASLDTARTSSLVYAEWLVDAQAMLTADPVKLAGKAVLEPKPAKMFVALLFAPTMLLALLMTTVATANVDLGSLVILTTDKDVLLL